MTRASIEIRDKQINAATDELSGGLLRIFGGQMPPSADTPTASSALAIFTLKTPAFYPAQNATAKSHIIASVFAINSGTASWFRLYTRKGAPAFDGTISLRGGGGSLIMTRTAIEAGDQVSVDSITHSLPE